VTSRLTLLEIADMFAEKLNFEDVYSSNADTSKEKAIGIYSRIGNKYRRCIGTTESYQVMQISVLIHWTENPSEAESEVNAVAEIIDSLRNESTSKHIIKFADVCGIHNIDKDENGICEYVADADIIYTDKE